MRRLADMKDICGKILQIMGGKEAADRRNPHRCAVRQRLYGVRFGILSMCNSIERSLRALPQDVFVERIRSNGPLQEITRDQSLVRHVVVFHQGVENDERLRRIIGKLPLLQADCGRIFRGTVLERLNAPENLPNPSAAQQLRRHSHRIAQSHTVKCPQNMISHTIASFPVRLFP